MSFLEYHQQELERRINKFEGECDQAVSSIRNLKLHARSFLEMLPSDRTELKERFLWCTRQLDEFMYLVSEFNLSLGKLEENDNPKTEASKDAVLTPMRNGQSKTNLSAAHMCGQKIQASETRQALQAKQTWTKQYQTKLVSQTSLDKQASTESTCQTKQTMLPKHAQTGRANWKGQSRITQSYTHWKEQSHTVQANRTEQVNWRVQASQTKQANLLPNETVQATRSKRANETEQATQSKPNDTEQAPRSKLANVTEQAIRSKQVNETAQATPSNQGSQATSRLGKEMEEDLIECSSSVFADEGGVEKMPEKNGTDEGCQDFGLALPPQPRLPAAESKACVASTDGANLWLVSNMGLLSKLINEMTEYYNKHQVLVEDLPAFSCCAYYDEETSSYFRGIYIRTEGVSEVFLVDTGESRPLAGGRLRPLAKRFCTTPALAHCCHLADVDLPNDEDLAEKQATLLNKHLWEEVGIKLHADEENNLSESQGIYVFLDDGTTLNELVARELASSRPQLSEPHISSDHDEESQPDDRQSQVSNQDNVNLDEDLCEGPEYENPLEAVTGYSNRDEVDICRHYLGGADKTCFKGPRCTKRHVLQHPDGWTLDRVPVVASCRSAPLPAPGTSCKVKVTHVRDVGCFFVQFEQKDETMTLAELVEEMTRDADKAKPLQIQPAVGELVSARFSDGRRYRARVTSCADQQGDVQVMYIDYGNESSVCVTSLRPLRPRWLWPAAAVRCRLAGAARAPAVTAVFKEMVMDRTLQARVIARCYDELTVELIDIEGFNVAEQLAVMADMPLEPYEIEDDSHRNSLLVPA